MAFRFLLTAVVLLAIGLVLSSFSVIRLRDEVGEAKHVLSSAEQKIFERDPSHIIPGQIEQDQDSLYQHFSQQEQLRDAFENQQREASINFQDQRKYLAEEDYSN